MEDSTNFLCSCLSLFLSNQVCSASKRYLPTTINPVASNIKSVYAAITNCRTILKIKSSGFSELDMNDSNRINEERAKIDIKTLAPSWVVDMAQNMKSICDVDDIDDTVFSLPPERLAELHSKLDINEFSKFLKTYLELNQASPIRLTSMLRLN